MMSALHVLSYIAGTGAFLFVLLSLASGLLYIAEVIEEHSGQAKVLGQRAIWVIIALLVALHIFDGLPLQITALGIFSHLVYWQNFSRSWPSVSFASPTFLFSCVLVLVDHFVSLNYFSQHARMASAFGSDLGYGGRASNHTARMNIAHVSRYQSTEQNLYDVATYFAICVWLCPFYLFLALSANDHVLPSNGSASSPTIPTESHASSPVSKLPEHHQAGQNFLKSLISSLIGFVPTTINHSRRRKEEQTFRRTGEVTKPDTSSLMLRRSPSATEVSHDYLKARNAISLLKTQVSTGDPLRSTVSLPSSPVRDRFSPPQRALSSFLGAASSGLSLPALPPRTSLSLGDIPAGSFVPRPASNHATLPSPPYLALRRHTTEEGIGLGVGASSSRVAPMPPVFNVMATPLSPAQRGQRPSISLGEQVPPRRSSDSVLLSTSGSFPGSPSRGPPPPASSSGMGFNTKPVPSAIKPAPTMGQGTPPRFTHVRTQSLHASPSTSMLHERRPSFDDMVTPIPLPTSPRPPTSGPKSKLYPSTLSVGVARPRPYGSGVFTFGGADGSEGIAAIA